MVLRYTYKKIARAFGRKTSRKISRKLKKHKRHRADAPPANGKCLLLEMPAEIRLRILEYTLCQSEPIQAHQNIKPRSSYNASYYGHSEAYNSDQWPQGMPCLDVLSTCRKLYQEGSEVFYNKNTFGITIVDAGYGTYGNVDMLGMGRPEMAFNTNRRLATCPSIKISLVLGLGVSCTTMGFGHHKDSIDEVIEQIHRSWRGQARLEIEVSQDGKQRAHHPIGASAMLHKMGLFRCKSVWFRGVPYSIAYKLTTLIESDRPVVDLQQAVRDLGAFLEGTYIRDDSHVSTYGEAYTEAEQYAAQHDVENFIRLRGEVIEAALQKMKSGVDRVQERGRQLKDQEIPVRSPEETDDAYRRLMALLNYM